MDTILFDSSDRSPKYCIALFHFRSPVMVTPTFFTQALNAASEQSLWIIRHSGDHYYYTGSFLITCLTRFPIFSKITSFTKFSFSLGFSFSLVSYKHTYMHTSYPLPEIALLALTKALFVAVCHQRHLLFAVSLYFSMYDNSSVCQHSDDDTTTITIMNFTRKTNINV